MLGGVGMTCGCVKFTGSVIEVVVGLFWLVVLCFTLLRRRCDRRSCVGVTSCDWTGDADSLEFEARSGVLVIRTFGKVWWSVLSFVEFSLELAEILEL